MAGDNSIAASPYGMELTKRRDGSHRKTATWSTDILGLIFKLARASRITLRGLVNPMANANRFENHTWENARHLMRRKLLLSIARLER
mmetsp:Transcript_20296/g.49805  ORF Transcript_20296/g.49805 Transcript_20296/m.49805 type:complete len:88 (+) Transcript_20296:767-1030(+)